MADIKIFDLETPAGLELFADNEGYLDDLTENDNAWGGQTNVVVSVDNKNGSISTSDDGFISLQNSSISTNK